MDSKGLPLKWGRPAPSFAAPALCPDARDHIKLARTLSQTVSILRQRDLNRSSSRPVGTVRGSTDRYPLPPPRGSTPTTPSPGVEQATAPRPSSRRYLDVELELGLGPRPPSPWSWSWARRTST